MRHSVRNAIHDFHQRGLAALQPKSSRPHTISEVIDAQGRERLRALLHQSPRTFGKDTSVWTLELAAQVSVEVGIASRRVSGQTIHNALTQLGVRWKRASDFLTGPDPDYVRKKHRRDSLIRLVVAHPTWALGFGDEVWWSRLAQPEQHRWVDADAVTHLQELEREPRGPRSQSAGVLRAAAARPQRPSRPDARALRGWPSGQRRDHRFPESVLSAAGDAGHHRPGADLGERFLAQEPAGSHLDPQPQSDRQADRAGRAHPALPVALQESLAQPH